MIDPNWMNVPRPSDPLLAAALYFGGSKASLARAIAYSPAAINMWQTRRSVPRRAALAIEQATLGEVPMDWIQSVYRGTTEATGGDEDDSQQ